MIIKVSPLIDSHILEPLRELEIQQCCIVKGECNAKLAGKDPDPINADYYLAILSKYIDLGRDIILSQITSLRHQLEEAI
ncbi:hypothetical protein JCM15519_22630 [Fundidesulfovibrio butyratiphilus]